MKNIFIILICSIMLLSCGGGTQNDNETNSEMQNTESSDSLKTEGDNSN